jgi:hypothetical protein
LQVKQNASKLLHLVVDLFLRLALFASLHLAKYQKYRHALKSIRERESSMTEVREKKKALQARIAALQKSSPRAGKLKEFQHELTSLVNDTRDQEAELADFKRFALREAFYLRFNAMAEYAEKTSLLAGFGKVRIGDLPTLPHGTLWIDGMR